MPNDLQLKFINLETVLTVQHAELIDLLTATNAKLDAIATALGAPPPSGQTTLADVLAELQAIHLDTTSQDAKLLRIRDAIWPLAESEPAGELDSIRWLLYRLVDAINPTWPRPTSRPVQPALDILTSALEPLDLAYWNDQIGISTGPTNNVIDLLEVLADNVLQLGPPQPPQPGENGVCANPYVSSLVQSHEGRSYAAWSGVEFPATISFTTALGLPTGVELSASAPNYWAGWSIFVYSRTATLYKEDPTSSGSFPTNTWRDLTGDYNFPLAVNVDGSHDLTVYLCPSPFIEDCDTIAAVSGAVNGVGRYAIAWPSGYDANNQQPNNYTWNIPAVAHVDMYGYTFKKISSSGTIRLVVWSGTTVVLDYQLGTTPYTLLSHSTSVLLDAYPANGPFTVEVCPPV